MFRTPMSLDRTHRTLTIAVGAIVALTRAPTLVSMANVVANLDGISSSMLANVLATPAIGEHGEHGRKS